MSFEALEVGLGLGATVKQENDIQVLVNGEQALSRPFLVMPTNVSTFFSFVGGPALQHLPAGVSSYTRAHLRVSLSINFLVLDSAQRRGCIAAAKIRIWTLLPDRKPFHSALKSLCKLALRRSVLLKQRPVFCSLYLSLISPQAFLSPICIYSQQLNGKTFPTRQGLQKMQSK